MAIPTRLQQDVDDLAVLVDGPPEVLALAADGHEQFVQMPGVADGPGPTPEPSRVGGAEGLAPVPDGLVRDGDAALGEEVFDVAEAEGEPVVEPDGVADDGGRESVAGIARRTSTGIRLLCPGSPQVDNTARLQAMNENSTGQRTVSVGSVGHGVFAATMIGLGIEGLIKRDFAPIWEPVPETLPARALLIYLCAFVALASGIGLLLRRTVADAARLLLAYLLLWLWLLRVPHIFISPTLDVWYRAARPW